MVLEIAQIEIVPGTEKKFELAVEKGRPLFLQSSGCLAFQLHKCLELPQRYRLLIQWNTLEDHTVGFRGSENFIEWRSLVQEYFLGVPQIEHYIAVPRTDEK